MKKLTAILFVCLCCSVFGAKAQEVPGGAIKLTHTMQEREHTLEELRKLEKVRNFLLSEGASDMDGFYDLIQNKR